MLATQAEEEGRAPAAAPSKAALKRARKKAAAAATAAAAAGVSAPISEGAASGLTTPSTPNALQMPAPAAAAAAAAASAAVPAAGLASAQTGMQQLQLQGAGSRPPAAPRVLAWMVCPLSHAVLVDPVLCTGDGQTYERSAITEWLAAADTSPVTGQPLTSRDLLPNHTFRCMIQAAQDHAARR